MGMTASDRAAVEQRALTDPGRWTVATGLLPRHTEDTGARGRFARIDRNRPAAPASVEEDDGRSRSATRLKGPRSPAPAVRSRRRIRPRGARVPVRTPGPLRVAVTRRTT